MMLVSPTLSDDTQLFIYPYGTNEIAAAGGGGGGGSNAGKQNNINTPFLTAVPHNHKELEAHDDHLAVTRNSCNDAGSPTTAKQQTAVQSPSLTSAAGEGRHHPAMSHVLVQLGKLYGVFYVPTRIRCTFAVGDLVQCEAGRGEGTGTVLCDVSMYLPQLRAWYQRHKHNTSDVHMLDPLCPEGDIVSPLYNPAVSPGLPMDMFLQRLPRVFRRGVNKDKKRVYFSRHRDHEALACVCRILQSRGWDQCVKVTEAVYQVDFLSLTLHCEGSAERCGWSVADFHSVGSYLTVPLRTNVVEFRFSDAHPEELHITRGLLGNDVGDIMQQATRGSNNTSNSSSNNNSVVKHALLPPSSVEVLQPNTMKIASQPHMHWASPPQHQPQQAAPLSVFYILPSYYAPQGSGAIPTTTTASLSSSNSNSVVLCHTPIFQ